MPSFLFSRKRKSLRIFFKLLEIYSQKDISLEKLINIYDNEYHFSLKTYKKYLLCLLSQIDKILKTLTKNIISIDNNSSVLRIPPDDSAFKSKIKHLLKLIKEIINILFKKKITHSILNSEHFEYFHYLIFNLAGIVLLKPP